MATLESSNRSASSVSSEHSFSARVVADHCELESLVPAWRQLTKKCSWRNPCYEPEFLIPLIKHRGDPSVRVLVVEGKHPEGGPYTLKGLMPLVDQRFYKLPFSCVGAWRPDESFDSTPLLDADHANSAFSTMLRMLSSTGVRLLVFDTVSASHDFDRVLIAGLKELGLSVFPRDHFSRAALTPCGSADEYLQNSLSKNRRKKAKKLLKKLEQRGEVEFAFAQDPAKIHHWAHDFVDLEARGWKGTQETAIASRSDSLAFFLEMADRYGDQRAIRFGRLTLDSTPIAMLVDIASEKHVSAYKTTYDEAFAEYSPGFLLELQNVRWLHDLGCTVCDSCTDPNNKMINGLYDKRLSFQNLVLGLDHGMNRWVDSMLPLMQISARKAKSIKHAMLSMVAGRTRSV